MRPEQILVHKLVGRHSRPPLLVRLQVFTCLLIEQVGHDPSGLLRRQQLGSVLMLSATFDQLWQGCADPR
eukprot:4568009-Prymnesium_polylepis.1